MVISTIAKVTTFPFKVGDPPLSMLDRKEVNACRYCGRAPFLTRDTQRVLTLKCETDAHRIECSGWPMKATVELWNSCNPRAA